MIKSINPRTNEPMMNEIIIVKKMTYKKDGKDKTFTKQLTFRNSYSIIPAPLKNFAQMFNLKVHKEIMTYKLYTKKNRVKNILPIQDFIDSTAHSKRTSKVKRI